MTDQHPDDGLDELIEETNELYEDFDAAAQENWQKRQEAEEPPSEESDQDGEDGGSGESESEREYQAELFLLVPHFKNRRKRPLLRRSQGASPPLDSAGIIVKQNGTPTKNIKAGQQYDVECTVQNVGGVGTSTMTAELFVEHKQPDVTLDTNNGEFEWTYGPNNNDNQLTGYTTFPPNRTNINTGIFFVYFVDQGNGLEWDNIVTWTADYGPSRIINLGGRNTEPQEFEVTQAPINSNTFTLRVYDASGMVSQVNQKADLKNKQEAQDFINLLENKATRVFETPGRWIKGRSHNHTKKDLNLSSSVNNATLQDRTQTNISSNSQTTVTFSYTAPQSQNNRSLTALYTRVYSLAPADTPRNWSALDHTTSRFVGRTELYWPLP